MTQDFEGKRVVVTGGTGALGSATVAHLLARGASVHVPVFHDGELTRFAHAKDVTCVTGIDLTDEDSCERFFETVGTVWASIHIAGGFSMGPIEETSGEEFTRLFRLNTLTCFHACRAAVAAMRRGSKGGRIVNVGARPALVPVGGMCAYAASKAAVVSLTQSLAVELAPEEIHVNAIVPSIMDTPANRAAMPDAAHAQWPSTTDVAATIGMLCSPANRVSSGALVPVFGKS